MLNGRPGAGTDIEAQAMDFEAIMNRLGIFLAVVIFAIGELIGFTSADGAAGQTTMLIMSSGAAAIVYALIRGIGWVFTGR
jgi:hypothetical protein